MDDVIVFGKTKQQTLDHLDAILGRIGQAGLTLKPSKCTLFKKRVHYLGKEVTEEGVMSDPEKIETAGSGWSPLPRQRCATSRVLLPTIEDLYRILGPLLVQNIS